MNFNFIECKPRTDCFKISRDCDSNNRKNEEGRRFERPIQHHQAQR